MLPMVDVQAPTIKRIYDGQMQSFSAPQHERVVVDFSNEQYAIPAAPVILWELLWGELDALRILAFVEKLLLPLKSRTLGVLIDRCEMGADRPWRELLALLPEEIPVFLELQGGKLELFPFELLDYLHIIWDEAPPYALPVLDRHLSFPPPKRLSKALLLPPKGASEWSLVDQAIEERVIAEERLIYDWDGIDELTIFPTALSQAGRRMVRGFAATGGSIREFRDAANRPQLQEI